MRIPFPDSPTSPDSNIVEFKPKSAEPTLKIVQRPWDACRHPNVLIEEEDRKVHCRTCKEALDPFDVILAFARRERAWIVDVETWEARNMSILSERFDQQWQRDKAEIKEPPADQADRKVWETFREFYGEKFYSMYKRKRRKTAGPQWYGRDTRGAMVSFEYARQQLMKMQAKQPAEATHEA